MILLEPERTLMNFFTMSLCHNDDGLPKMETRVGALLKKPAHSICDRPFCC